jgi:purine-nucleoside phosphorylase
LVAQSIVKPDHFRAGNYEKLVYIPWNPPCELLGDELKKAASRNKLQRLGDLYRFEKKAVLYGAPSAPLACLALEPFIVSGVREIIVLGVCGSLNPRFRIADTVSIAGALSDEGTSRHYLPGRHLFIPSLPLKRAIEACLRSRGFKFDRGTIISTDAPFRETKAWLDRAGRQGAELVDMETSAVLALAEFHGIRAASLQVVSDELFTGDWKSAFSDSALRRRVRDCFLPVALAGT